MQRQYLASAALHGKFFIDEGDDMTHLEKRKKRPDRRCTVNTMEESLALLYREFGMTVTHGTGLWYMDLTRGTFRDPQLVDAVGRMRKWAEVALRHDRSHHSEVAVVSQPQSGFYTGQGGPFVGTVTQQLYVKLRAIYKAAGVHVYTDSDVVLSANSAWLMLHTRVFPARLFDHDAGADVAEFA